MNHKYSFPKHACWYVNNNIALVRQIKFIKIIIITVNEIKCFLSIFHSFFSLSKDKFKHITVENPNMCTWMITAISTLEISAHFVIPYINSTYLSKCFIDKCLTRTGTKHTEIYIMHHLSPFPPIKTRYYLELSTDNYRCESLCSVA